MTVRRVLVVLIALALSAFVVAPGAGSAPRFRPGAAGIGDSYYPRDGNGGYDVAHYDLDLTYQPGNNRLSGVATIRAFATQNLSRFDLDLDGLKVLSVLVGGRPADWSRRHGELIVTPARGIRRDDLFTTVVTYAGVPGQAELGGYLHTDDGAMVVGQPHVASYWFPVNDHPTDKASYSFAITVPRGRQVVANGELVGRTTLDGWTTWHWEATEPMASYLATASIGKWKFRNHDGNGIPLTDALDPDLAEPFATPRTGDGLAFSKQGNFAYERLTRTLSVPADGGTLSFRVLRDTEEPWDWFAVEAHTVGEDDWTTLPDTRGHTDRYPGAGCPGWFEFHPFLEHYQTALDDETCRPRGTTGRWYAATGQSGRYEHWTVDLAPYAGSDVEISLSSISDNTVQQSGVFVDDVVSTTGEGSTSFEPDGDPGDGWEPSAPPAGSEDVGPWTVGTADDVGSLAKTATAVFDRQGDMLDFIADLYGPYPFSVSGGVVDDIQGLGFALENQTRPVYAPDFFYDPEEAESVVVHELSHQWTGDSLAVRRWRDIWLNEGFATYVEWLWSEHEGRDTAAQIFDGYYEGLPTNTGFWELPIGDPGPENLLEIQIYWRGAMTLQALRETIGDDAFFDVLHRWTTRHEGGNVGTPQFIALAERVSGEDLDTFFQRWLFGDRRPADPSPRTHARLSAAEAAAFWTKLQERVRRY